MQQQPHQRSLTLMDVLAPNRGIRNVMNALLDGHRLHNDADHKRWRQEVSQAEPEDIPVPITDLESGVAQNKVCIYKEQLDPQSPCFIYTHKDGIQVIPATIDPDGYVWKVELKKGHCWLAQPSPRYPNYRENFVVLRAYCADIATAIKMRDDYILHGYYPQTDQLRVANRRAYLEDKLHRKWREEVDEYLDKNTDRSFLCHTNPHTYKWLASKKRAVIRERGRRLRDWLDMDRTHRPTPDPQLVAATGLPHFQY